MLRLFFALLPAPAQSGELAERLAPLIAQLDAQAVPATNLHATLCFIGAVPEERLVLLCEVAARVHASASTLCFDALEHWAKPKILCVTAAETRQSAPARLLAERLSAAALDAEFTPDVKPFRAHLTLARKVSPRRAGKCDWPRDLSPAVRVHCDRFVLMKSERGVSGSIYSVVASWPLDASGVDESR